LYIPYCYAVVTDLQRGEIRGGRSVGIGYVENAAEEEEEEEEEEEGEEEKGKEKEGEEEEEIFDV
jgi:hypothetical protein